MNWLKDLLNFNDQAKTQHMTATILSFTAKVSRKKRKKRNSTILSIRMRVCLVCITIVIDVTHFHRDLKLN